jgi:lactate dehydrogenase-like 2-hydroxyacid dehydrogenase
MSQRDVLVMAAPRPKAMAQLEASYHLHRFDLADDKPAFLAEIGSQCQAVVTNGHTELTRAQIAQLPNVGVVACTSAGFETIDDAALRDAGIALTNSSDALSDDVADVALMLALAARRQLVAAHAYVTSGDWGRQGMYPLLSTLTGKRAGIVGLGTIGTAIAKRFEPLGLDIGYTARSAKPVDYAFFPDTLSLAQWSDILVVIVPGGAATQGLISREVIHAVGPTGTIINVARGSVVDEPALIAALCDGQLGSAGLDVYLNEPNPDPALSALANVTLYPHHASGTLETRDAMAQTVVDNLAAHFAGQPLLTPVFAPS